LENSVNNSPSNTIKHNHRIIER